MKDVPIADYMTTIPVQVDESATFSTVLKLMQRYGIRHIPITQNGKISGILSERDVQVLKAAGAVEMERDPVKKVIERSPYTVQKTTPLSTVVSAMIENKFGCVVVEDSGSVVGIFTVIDALRFLNSNSK